MVSRGSIRNRINYDLSMMIQTLPEIICQLKLKSKNTTVVSQVTTDMCAGAV